LSANGDLNLGAPAPYSLGLVPVVGLNDRDEFVAMQDYGDISFLPTSILLFLMTKDFLPGKNTDRWMELTPTMHRKTLRSILLPGTHDSAAYILHTNSNSGPVNARGPDWKGLEEACANIKEGWLGDRLREKCEELLPQLFPHTENEIAKDVTLAQSQSLGDQLYGGIRFFDLRVTPRDGAYRAYHGLIGDPAAPMLDEIRAFMDMVAMELVLIDVSHLNVGTHEKNDHRGYTDQEHDALMALLVTKLGPYLIRRDDRSSKNLLDTPFRQLTADGPRIILVYSDKYLDNHPEHPLADYFWPADFFFGAFTNTTELRYQVYGDGEDLVGQRERFDEFLAGSRSDLFRLYQTLTADSNLTAKNFVFDRVLGSHYRPTLHGLSQDTNQHLSQFLDEGVPDFPNLALVDFYEESDVVGRAIEISGLCDQTAIAGSLEVNPPSTWPPNHSMATVEVDVSGLESRNPDSFDALISAIDVEELDRKTGEDIYGPNNFEPDWEIIGDLTALIRSEREGRAESRYYVITVTASDCSGDYDFRAAVPVPHDHGH
jgi:hypothetical protein